MSTKIYHRTFKIKKKKVEFLIKSNYIINKNNIIFFGNPIHNNLNIINKKNLLSEIKNIEGFFLILLIDKNNIILYNDILANFRLYYKENKKGLIFSSDYNFFLKKKIAKLDSDEFNFWMSKNYTSGDKTFFKDLYKLPPASNLNIDQNFNLKIKNNFKNFIKSSNKNSSKSLEKSINNSIQLLKNTKKKIILLFSGGADSLLLAQKLKEKNCNFECVYFSTKPNTYESEKGYRLAKKLAECLNIKLNIIPVKFEINNLKFKKILKVMLFDFHTCIVQFFGISKILKKFGRNIEIISGQSADSILCYGPSASTLSNFINRILYIKNTFFTNFLIKFYLEKKYKVKLIAPKNIFENYYFFYNSFFYYPLYKKNNIEHDISIKNKINKVINEIKMKDEFVKMYLKIFGFLQGPDNQVLIQSALYNNFSNISLPYVTSEIISSTCYKQNKLKTVINPKHEIKVLLNKNLIKKLQSDKPKINGLRKISSYIPRIKKIYLKRINELKK